MTNGHGGVPMDGENPDLKAMHRDLIALVRRLEESVDSAPTAAAIGAISDQIVEVNARVTAAGRLLLAAQTEEISRHACAVSAAIPGIEDEIEDLRRYERVVRSIATVLDVADEAIRVATMVCR
ncbi:hypothetical protein ACFQ15_00510 [Sphingomonas hankookensis]|uniref:hypothetical protein n=1 Tax=Sphingomonas hankookensis TaxID=563996 RepID=UPI001F590007|nr:hypothetical protein [Sphingomonas hankookensis]